MFLCCLRERMEELLTVLLHTTPVVWWALTYAWRSIREFLRAFTHSTCVSSLPNKNIWLIQWTELFHHYIIRINYSTKFQKLTANWTYDINDASMVMLHPIKLNYITSHQITPKWHTMEYLKLTSFKFFWLKHPDLLSFEVLQYSVKVELCCINHFFYMWSWSGALSEWNQSCNFPF